MITPTLMTAEPKDAATPLQAGDQLYIAPPSFAQQRLWLMHQVEPLSPVFVLPAAFRLQGKLNTPALHRALNEILRRHEVLRTCFGLENGALAQFIAPAMELALPVLDLQSLPEVERASATERWLAEEMRRPFNLGQAPLWRAALLRLGPEEHIFLFNIHHMVADGLSCGLLGRELEALYGAFRAGRPASLPPLPVQYADYAIWERKWMQGERLHSQLAYWKEQLQGALPILELPADRPRPARQTFKGKLLPLEFSLPLTNALKALSRREQTSLFMALLAAYKVLLYRYTGQSDLLVAAPIANRSLEELEPLIGFFVNLLVFRTQMSGALSFRACLRHVKEVAASAYAHKEAPFEKLVEQLHPQRDLSHHPLAQVLFAFHAAPLDLSLAGLECHTLPVDNGAAKFDLYFELWETAGRIGGRIEYCTDLFDPARVERMAGHFKTLLEGIVANPDQPLSELPLLTAPEQHQVLVAWNDTQRPLPPEQCIHQLFEAQVARTPQAVALVCGQQRLSYAELNAGAERLATQLRGWGVGAETLVGVCLERSPLLVTAILAILKAGGAYVPLDPLYPRDRLQFTLADARTPILLTQEKFSDRFAVSGTQVICLEAQGVAQVSKAAAQPSGGRLANLTAGTAAEQGVRAPEAAPAGASSRQLAYVLYTSGSTGRPKGVGVEHRSVVNLIAWATALYPAEELAGVLAATSVCFDLSVFELFVPLSCGGKVILADNPLQLPQLPAAGEVTLLNTVPSAMAELLRLGRLPRSVRVVNLAGEPLAPQLVDRVYQAHPSVRKVYDLYGPTEDTVYSTFTLRRPGGPATIGRPLPNKRLYILDERQQPVPVGVPGELCIAGAGLARGYLHRPELTAERFVVDPFSSDPAARLYRTGDLVRYLPDGNVEFLGRTDQQVKLRGYRIELGEVEAVLAQHPAISEAAAALQGQTDKQLVAYLCLKPGPAPAEDELRQFARRQLPDYMMPSMFRTLAALPLNPSGKVDRKALAGLETGQLAHKQASDAPMTPVQQRLAVIWTDILALQQVGINDNFFSLGGHSLPAMQVANRIAQEFEIDFSMVTLFEAPTIAQIAHILEHQRVA